MHKDFYASGFLYHPDSQQILLQQQTPADTNSAWSLLGDICPAMTDQKENFRRIVHKFLKLKLPSNSVHSIYDYFHSEIGSNHFVSYVEVKELAKFPPIGNKVFAWFSFTEIPKLKMSEKAKQDVVVGLRVIRAGERKLAGERFIE